MNSDGAASRKRTDGSDRLVDVSIDIAITQREPGQIKMHGRPEESRRRRPAGSGGRKPAGIRCAAETSDASPMPTSPPGCALRTAARDFARIERSLLNGLLAEASEREAPPLLPSPRAFVNRTHTPASKFSFILYSTSVPEPRSRFSTVSRYLRPPAENTSAPVSADTPTNEFFVNASPVTIKLCDDREDIGATKVRIFGTIDLINRIFFSLHSFDCMCRLVRLRGEGRRIRTKETFVIRFWIALIVPWRSIFNINQYLLSTVNIFFNQ